ncbi:hypothetical protein ACMFMG_011991 [Clarireedia jacksonii]
MDANEKKSPQYAKYFLACVKIDLSNLTYIGNSDPTEKTKKIEKLTSILTDYCDRHNPDNFITALITKEAFETLRSSNSAECFGTSAQRPPVSSLASISSTTKISYIDGLSRIKAAEHCLPHQDKWWLVNLYNQDIGQGFLSSQGNRNNRSTANPSGVEVRELLKLRSRDDQTVAEQLAVGFSKDTKKDLKAIKNRDQLNSALTALQDVSGLWTNLNGGLKRTSLKGCDDTVNLVESIAPGISLMDRDHFIKSMNNESFFGMEDQQTRDHLKAKILSTTRMIPTLNSYARDTMHLLEIVSVLKLLLGRNDKRLGPRSIRTALKRIWKGPEMSQSIVVEDIQDGEFAELTTSEQFDSFDIQFKSLILHVMRNYRSLGNYAARTEPGEEKAKVKEATARNLYLFGLTAGKLGFQSDAIQRLLQINFVRETFAKSLQDIAPQDVWEYDLEAAVDKQCRAYEEMLDYMNKKVQAPHNPKPLSEIKLSRRYGKPVTTVIDESTPYLFLRHLCNSTKREAKGVTARTVRSEFFSRFWGSLELKSPEFFRIDTHRIPDTQTTNYDDNSSVYSHSIVSNDATLRENGEDSEVRERQNIDLEEDHKRLTMTLQEAERQIQNHIAVGIEKDNRIEVLNQEQQHLKIYITQKDKDITELNNINKVQIDKIKSLESQINEFENLQIEYDKQQQKEQKQNDNLISMKQQVEDSSSRIKQLQESLQKADHLYKETCAQQEDHLREELSKHAAQHLETIKQMQNQINNLNENIPVASDEWEMIGTLKEGQENQGSVQGNKSKQIELEKEIANLMNMILQIQSRLLEIPEHKDKLNKAIQNQQTEISKDSELRDEDIKNLRNKLEELETERKSKDRKSRSLKSQLTELRFNLLELSGGEVLFYKKDRSSNEVLEQPPTKVVINKTKLTEVFNGLLEKGCVASCKKGEGNYFVRLGDPMDWKRHLADPPGVDDNIFYVETLKRKRNDESENIQPSRNTRGKFNNNDSVPLQHEESL